MSDQIGRVLNKLDVSSDIKLGYAGLCWNCAAMMLSAKTCLSCLKIVIALSNGAHTQIVQIMVLTNKGGLNATFKRFVTVMALVSLLHNIYIFKWR